MWVRELLIDEFDGGGDLTLHQLNSTLNVIRLPSAATAGCLAEFIPNLLYGPSADDAPSRAGSLMVAQQADTGTWEVLDLCRLPLESNRGLSDLQILAHGGEVVDQERLLETIDAIDGPIYRAVFTDIQPLPDRLAVWRSADWMIPLLRRTEVVTESDTGTVQRGGQPLPSPSDARLAVLNRAVARCVEITPAIESTRSPLNEATAEREGETPTAQSPPEDTVDSRSAGTVPSQDRQRYLEAKQQSQSLRIQIGTLRERLQRQEHDLNIVEQAVGLQATWDQLQSLAGDCEADTTPPVTAGDVQQLRRWNRQTATVRRQLQHVQQIQAATVEGPRDESDEELTVQRCCGNLQSLIDRWPACEEHQRHAETLRVELASCLTSGDAERAGTAKLRDAAVRLRRAASARRAARHQLEAATRKSGQAAPPSPRSQAQIESLRRQIRQLREESRRLLDRQLLSRQALFGIGLLFSAGVAVLLSALLLELDGAEMATGSIGLTCILAAALLKSSFERAPTYQMRQQRLRIAALLAEVEQLKGTSADLVAPAHRLKVPGTDGDTPAGVTASAQARWEAAELAWLALLDELAISEERSPASALQQLCARAHAASFANDEPQTEACLADIHDHEAHVAQWCREAAATLAAIPLESQGELPESELPESDVTLDTWRLRLHGALLRLSATPPPPTPAPSDDVQSIADLQAQLKRLKHRRRSMLQRYDVRDIGQLEERLQREKRRAQQQSQRDDLRQQIEKALPAEPDAGRIRDWFASALDLDAERELQQQAIRTAQQQISSAQRELVQFQSVIDRVAQPRSSATTDSETSRRCPKESRDELDIVIAHAVLAEIRAAALKSNADEENLPAKRDVVLRRPPLLQQATEYLRAIWDDHSVEVDWDDVAVGPYVVDAEDVATSFDDLPFEQQHGLLFALQLSLVQCLTRRVGHLPVIVTDRTFDQRENTAPRIAELLSIVANAGQQVLVVTHDAGVSDCFKTLNVPTLVVTRQVPAATATESTVAELRWLP